MWWDHWVEIYDIFSVPQSEDNVQITVKQSTFGSLDKVRGGTHCMAKPLSVDSKIIVPPIFNTVVLKSFQANTIT